MLIPKIQGVDKIYQFKQIALANFKHKVINKIIVYRLAKVVPRIIPQEQKGFIHGRIIRDCILLTVEVSNLMHKKIYGDNIVIKVDI